MGAHDFCAEMLRSKARCALIVLLTGGLCWITVILVIDFRDQRQSVTRSEVVTLASQTPPWLALFSNPVFAGTCYVSAVKCTFFETPEELISSAAETEDDILSHQVALMRSRSKDCTAALHLLSPFCSSAHACTVEELCGEATSCPQQLFVGYYFNTTTAAALGATFRGAGRQQMTLEVTTAADCMPLSAMRVLTVYAFNGRVHSNGEPVLDVQRLMESTKLALDGSLADDLDQVALYMRMWGSPSYVDTRSAANVLFRYTDRIDLDGNVDRHVQMETSQIRTSLPCKDRTDSDACGSVTPAQCQADDGTALRCPARCGLCRTDAAQHKVLLSVRPLSMTKVVHTEQRGQRALELFGHIFDFAGVMMAGSVLGVFDTVLRYCRRRDGGAPATSSDSECDSDDEVSSSQQLSPGPSLEGVRRVPSQFVPSPLELLDQPREATHLSAGSDPPLLQSLSVSGRAQRPQAPRRAPLSVGARSAAVTREASPLRPSKSLSARDTRALSSRVFTPPSLFLPPRRRPRAAPRTGPQRRPWQVGAARRGRQRGFGVGAAEEEASRQPSDQVEGARA
eukprot:TRINITY_DN3212_c0_g2_i2.p1 TRINITY_DN3212_c0_g2~~TRINITY_DN3212_c0_g2_i2.p1  ORF type:complete len:583 (+),score=156.83 TRINITY_DN3212_c0_g2_i2:47-1750(+)